MSDSKKIAEHLGGLVREGFISSIDVQSHIDGTHSWTATVQGSGVPPINSDLMARNPEIQR